jgi:hypothetical protein
MANPNPKSKFKPGNAGRPKGTKNKATRDIQRLIQDSVDFNVLNAKLYELAQGGEKWAMEMIYQYGYGKPVEIQVTMPPMNDKPSEVNVTHAIAPGSMKGLEKLAGLFAER